MLKSLRLAWALLWDWIDPEPEPEARPEIHPPPPEPWDEPTLVSEYEPVVAAPTWDDESEMRPAAGKLGRSE